MIEKFAPAIVKRLPKLEENLKIARMKDSARDYVVKIIKNSLMIGLVFGFLLFVLFSKIEISLLWVVLMTPLIMAFAFFFFYNAPIVYISKRAKEINKDVLFAGRYLLVKVESGEPLFSSLIGVAKGYGATGKVFNEIVQDIHFGSKIEDAIDKAIKYNPSTNLRKILWEISNSIKTGSDMSKSLRSILNTINEEYYTEIEKYGKKINSLTLFYMVLAIIMPSLGMTMFIVISSFLNISIPITILYIVIFFIIFLQFMFVSMFRSIRPAVAL